MCVLEGLQEGTTIVRISNLSGTKSDEMVVRVEKKDVQNYAYIHVMEGLVWNMVIGEARNLTVQARGAKNENDEQRLLNALEGVISNQTVMGNRPVVDGKSRGSDGRWSWNFQYKAAGAGESEVTFRVKTGEDALLADYPALKNVNKKVYFRVQEGDNIYAVDKTNIRMFETGVGEMITATIDTSQTAFKATEIKWRANDSGIIQIVQNMPANDAMGTSVVMINALKAGETWIEVEFGNVTKIVYVSVQATEYVRADKANISIAPNEERTFIVYANPGTSDITLTADSNVGCDIYGRQVGATGDWARVSKFIAGTDGYEIKVVGTELEGTVRITFTMESTQKKTQVTVNNIKNYYVRWIDKSSFRLRPDEPETSENVKLYYECNPADDYLEYISSTLYNEYFEVECDKDSIEPCALNGGKMTRYIKLKKNQRTKEDNQLYFRPVTCAKNGEMLPLRFQTRLNRREVEVSVYIYFEKIDVSWSKGNNPPKSKFDMATYAINLAPNTSVSRELRIDLNVGNSIERAALLWGKPEWSFEGAVKPTVNVYKNENSNPTHFIISRGPDVGEQNRANLTETVYMGLLTVRYKCFNGGSVEELVERKFLVYKDKY
jgi:hypothetical protein